MTIKYKRPTLFMETVCLLHPQSYAVNMRRQYDYLWSEDPFPGTCPWLPYTEELDARKPP